MSTGSTNMSTMYFNRETLAPNKYLLINHEAVRHRTDRQTWIELPFSYSALKVLSTKGDYLVGKQLQVVEKQTLNRPRQTCVKVKWFVIDERMRQMISPLAYKDIKLDLQLNHILCSAARWRDTLYPLDLVHIKIAPKTIEEQLVHPDFYVRILAKQELKNG